MTEHRCDLLLFLNTVVNLASLRLIEERLLMLLKPSSVGSWCIHESVIQSDYAAHFLIWLERVVIQLR